MSPPRKCGAGCGGGLRRGKARDAYVLTLMGSIARARICSKCASRGIVLVVHVEDATLSRIAEDATRKAFGLPLPARRSSCSEHGPIAPGSLTCPECDAIGRTPGRHVQHGS